ncbi:hypothetical protein V6N12_031126 [Hibiscus sabdariffa]|uniref:Uncharacterized protein n=1 Tax=Hibiscus sabdariffa TaxID=183260 RepID=A0ABR2E807_9ROSI
MKLHEVCSEEEGRVLRAFVSLYSDIRTGMPLFLTVPEMSFWSEETAWNIGKICLTASNSGFRGILFSLKLVSNMTLSYKFQEGDIFDGGTLLDLTVEYYSPYLSSIPISIDMFATFINVIAQSWLYELPKKPSSQS